MGNVFIDSVVVFATVGLIVYLLYALVLPERF